MLVKRHPEIETYIVMNNTGYVDYSLGVREDGSTAITVERTTVTQDDIDEATRSFLRFNGFVENGILKF